MWIPFGTNINAIRTGASTAELVASALTGAMLSNKGSDIAAPKPFKKVRLGMFLVILL
jgi:hypothetical protein